MLIKYSKFCYDDTLIIDGMRWEELSSDKQREILMLLVEKRLDDNGLRGLMVEVIDTYTRGSFIKSNYCEQCGDYNEFHEVKL